MELPVHVLVRLTEGFLKLVSLRNFVETLITDRVVADMPERAKSERHKSVKSTGLA